MKGTRAKAGLPLTVRRGLTKLGGDISAARRRRRISMELLAERAFVSRATLRRVERGDPAVGMGIYATVLFLLGLSDRIAALAEPTSDEVGLGLDEERLPRRVRTSRRDPDKGRKERMS